MRCLAWLVLPLVALLVAGCADTAAIDAELRATAEREIARRPDGFANGEARAFLIRRDGVERALLWGTMHVSYSAETVMPAPIRRRFSDSASLIVETVIDRVPRAEMQALAARFRKANSEVDPVAFQALDPATRDAVVAIVPAEELRRTSLRGVATAIAVKAATQPGNDLPTVGFVDTNLIGFARSQGRPVFGLEPPQINDPTLDSPNGPGAAADVRWQLRRRAHLVEMLRWVRTAYGRGDIAGAIAVLDAWQALPADLVRVDQNRPALLTRRNVAWVPRLERLLEPLGPHFIAVGAGHLPGDQGLVALLRARGWEVLPCPGDVCP